MKKAIGSKINLSDLSTEVSKTYWDCVNDIIDAEIVKNLEVWTHHNKTNRLQHSINVSYYSFLVCKKLGLDYRSAARAGILHDLFFYDWRVDTERECNHAAWHPKVAIENAKTICELNKTEEDAILNHMWPCTPSLPKTGVGKVITLVDKVCAVLEFFGARDVVADAVADAVAVVNEISKEAKVPSGVLD